MSAKKKEFPRDLRGLCGGVVKESDGSERVLPFPVKSYLNLWEYITGLEQWLEDFDGSNEDKECLSKHLERAKADLPELKQRILDHFKARPGIAGKPRVSETVDYGAKSKVEKALNDVEAGKYDRSSQTMTLQAVLQALAFSLKKGRMPLHHELKGLKALNGLKFNDQQAADAGKWLAMQSDLESNEDSLFQPLPWKERRGRPKKK